MLCRSIVDDVIRYGPAEQEGEETIHEMILEHILGLHGLLIRPQKLEHIHKTQHRPPNRIGDQPREASQPGEGDQHSQEEPEDLLHVEEQVRDLLLCVVALAREG